MALPIKTFALPSQKFLTALIALEIFRNIISNHDKTIVI